MAYETCAKRLGLNEFNTHFNISLKNKYVYVGLPKVACTTIKSSLSVYELRESGVPAETVQRYRRNPHMPVNEMVFTKPYQLGKELFEKTLATPEITVFCFVRNPYARVLSAYLDKVQRKEPQINSIRKELAELRGVAPSEATVGGVSFEEFLLATRKKAETGKVDRHWRPQALHLCTDIISYDFVGRLETFENDIDYLLERLTLPELEIVRRDPHRTNANEKLSEFYDARTLDLVREIYDRDFEVFGYSKEQV